MLSESQQYDPSLQEYINKGRKLFDAMTPSTESAGVVSTDKHYYLYLLVCSRIFVNFADLDRIKKPWFVL
jgi:hypothetical protein